jgi:hypothetical protein
MSEQNRNSGGPTEAEWNEYYEEEGARQVAEKELPNLQLTAKAIDNLNRNAKIRRDEPRLRLEPVEKTLLIFDPEKIEAVKDWGETIILNYGIYG